MSSKHTLTLITFLSLTLLIFAFSWKNSVVFTDELLFEEASYQMLQTGDPLAPRLRGEIWLEKPPLYFLLTSAIYRVTAPTPFTRRLVTLLAATATLITTYALARHFYSPKVASWAIIILTVTPLFFFFSKTANLDIPATFFTSATILAYLKSKTDPRWLRLAGITLGLGILTRSFLALTPVPIIAADYLLSKNKPSPRNLAAAFLITMLISLPWHVYVWKKYPNIFVNEYLGFNLKLHLLFQTPGHPFLPPLQFLFNVLVVFAPLNLLILGNFIPQKKLPNPPKRLFVIWILTVLFPLTLAVTRHEWYALQAIPPLSILSALGFVKIEKFLKSHVRPSTLEITTIFLVSIMLTLPTTVTLNLQKDTKSVSMLKKFIQATPPKTPLFNLDYQYTPQTTLYNLRNVSIIQINQLETLKAPIYLYLDNKQQSQQIKEELNLCCHQEVLTTEEDAVILRLLPK